MNRTGPGGKLPGPWNVRGLHLVPDDGRDPRDSSMDSPDRIAEREANRVSVEALKRLRDAPIFKGCDDVDETFMVLPIIHVRVRTADRDQAVKDLQAWLAIQVGGAHVKGFIDWSIGPDVEVI